MDYHEIKDEIINFVLNSPEEENSKVAVFIAGMQARKNLTDHRRETGRCSFISGGDGVPIIKTGPVKK